MIILDNEAKLKHLIVFRFRELKNGTDNNKENNLFLLSFIVLTVHNLNRFRALLEQLTNRNYSAIQCERKTKIVHGYGSFNINCGAFVEAFETSKVS